MFRYFYRIFDRYRKPVTAVAIFTGQDGKRMPDQFKYEFMRTRLVYEYNTLSITDFTDEELEKSENPFCPGSTRSKDITFRRKDTGTGIEQEKYVKNLLANTEFSDDKIASPVDVPVSFVERIKEEIYPQ